MIQAAGSATEREYGIKRTAECSFSSLMKKNMCRDNAFRLMCQSCWFQKEQILPHFRGSKNTLRRCIICGEKAWIKRRYWKNLRISGITSQGCSEFNLIEENTKTVFIPREPEAAKLLDQIRYHGYTKSGMRKAGQYCVQLYENEFEKFRGAGMVRLISENITDFTNLSMKMCIVMIRGWISESILEWRL